MTAQRAAAIAIWLAASAVIIASVVRGTGATTTGMVAMFAALILLRICDLEDRIKRLSDRASRGDELAALDYARHAPDQGAFSCPKEDR